MSGKQQPTRNLTVPALQGLLWLEDKLGPFLEASAVVALGFVFFVTMISVGHPTEGVVVFSHSLISAVIVFLLRRAARQQTILIEITMSYLIHGDKSLLDHLLGRLIAGKWSRQELRPGSALFDVLDKICESQQSDAWETKRRIAEALPALAEADAKRALKIVKTLRGDWDEARYKSDLRRRAVEALITPMRRGHSPLLDRVRSEEVIPLLQARDGDQVFTAFAIAEALGDLDQTKPEVARPLQKQLQEFAHQKYLADESEAIEELVDFLTLSKTADAFKIANRLKEMSKNTNEFIRIAAARNLLTISDRLQDDTLDLMLTLSEAGQPNNVRRPIAKEQSVKFLVEMLQNERSKERAKNLLLRLVADPDQIIRVTTFDMSEALMATDRAFIVEMASFILKNEPTQSEPSRELMARAERLQASLSE